MEEAVVTTFDDVESDANDTITRRRRTKLVRLPLLVRDHYFLVLNSESKVSVKHNKGPRILMDTRTIRIL